MPRLPSAKPPRGVVNKVFRQGAATAGMSRKPGRKSRAELAMTGQLLVDPKVKLDTYPVTVQNGEVSISVASEAPSLAAAPVAASKAPARTAAQVLTGKTVKPVADKTKPAAADRKVSLVTNN